MTDRPSVTTALLIVDMISRWDFEDADRLIVGALKVHEAIAALKRRCRAAGVPARHLDPEQPRPAVARLGFAW